MYVLYKILSITICCSVAQSCHVQLCNPMNYSIPGFPVLHHLLEIAQALVHRVGDTIQPSHPQCPLLLLPTIPPSIRVFSSESILRIRWPKYWSFSFGIIPSNEHLGVISSSMDCLEFLAVQGTLKSLLQHHSSNSLVFSFLHSPTLTSIYSHWGEKKNSLG